MVVSIICATTITGSVRCFIILQYLTQTNYIVFKNKTQNPGGVRIDPKHLDDGININDFFPSPQEKIAHEMLSYLHLKESNDKDLFDKFITLLREFANQCQMKLPKIPHASRNIRIINRLFLKPQQICKTWNSNEIQFIDQRKKTNC